jgi:biopolymer transport protein ExbB
MIFKGIRVMRSTNQRPHWARRLTVAVTACGLLALPLAASAFWNHDWSYRKQIAINPGANGIVLKGDLADVPVLIRLHEGVFKFSDANADGSDLRFVADDDKTPLKFHIEKYDSVFNLAYVWVMIPKVHAGDKTNIWMYYGNSHATSASDARETYDPDQVLVYHFAERGTPAIDSTGYANNSTSTATPDETGLIGTGAKFTAQAAVLVPTSASLSLASAGASTLSFWIKPAASGSDAVLYARHEGTRALIVGLDKGAAYVSVTADSGQVQRTAATIPLGEKAWHHIAITTGAQIALYIDGAVSGTLDAATPSLSTVASIGGDAPAPGTPPSTGATSIGATSTGATSTGATSTGAAGFAGEIDEFEISKVARDPSYVQFESLNQGSSGKLLEFGADEQLSTWSSGYVGIILRSVTLDGWVVIGILLVMAVTSWAVMYLKTRQVLRAAAANRAFTALQKQTGGDMNAFNQHVAGLTMGLPEGKRILVQDSPLFRMFSAGINELRQRVDAESVNGQKNSYVSAHSIEAIRATLDSSLVDELDALDDRMVVLTIAISGGPFLGLLGTVVGVMITFAAIAASGDVNINSIAPGIAAALVATVAGLIVAIPALFGYNYLTTRIRRMTAQMQVYIDSFITRMAENYRSPAEGQAAPTNGRVAQPARRDPSP